jgi:uncharacterized phage protein (TIGR01671 family)
MKREIKFRAWNKSLNKWHWFGFENYASESHQDRPQNERIGYYWLTPYWTENKDKVEWNQFTGLLDKSGKEIYERDIVKCYGYEVRNGHQIRPERIFIINDFIKDTYRLLCITEGTGETVEVIGNIYENPDLL